MQTLFAVVSFPMALSASSSCAKPVMAISEPSKVATRSSEAVGGVVPLPVKPTFERSSIQRTKSRKAVKGTTKVSAVAAPRSEDVAVDTSLSVDELSTVAGEVVESVESEEQAGAIKVRKTGGSKSNSKTSRRRALVMCLALGMVRPCASNVEGSSTSGAVDLRRTASAMPLRRTTSNVPRTLLSQVSLATTMKQTNLLGEQEDLQKLTSLQ